ncbi:hypothetical protein Bpfe_016632 [Biomphalaria pfeifferi]|uniref:C-type lectin domain-containing protein n=1 Tax=Biomphalaria pfeifferi TaxID=112525 RepID=A0AAD8BH57_BIOPF|nr:hypothetical protein Bpfe_016632 [Biomphalaria pfeifferi]
MSLCQLLLVWTYVLVITNRTSCKVDNAEDITFYVSQRSLPRQVEIVYTLMRDKLPWNQALAACQKSFGQYGGTLVTLDGPDIAYSIFQRMSKSDENFWTGLHCADDNCNLKVWSDCSQYDGDKSRLDSSEDGMCYYVEKEQTDKLVKKECSQKYHYVCQYMKPNSSTCNNICTTDSNINMCRQVGKYLTFQSASGTGTRCYEQCVQTQGCWMFWDVDKKACLLGVSACYTVNVSNAAVSVPEDARKTPMHCSLTSEIQDTCMTSTVTLMVSSLQQCDNTVTTTMTKSASTVTRTVTLDVTTKVLVPTTLTLSAAGASATTTVTTTVTIETAVPPLKTTTVYRTECSETLTLDRMLEARCSYPTKQSEGVSELMTSFSISPTSSLQVATAALTGNAPSPSNQASSQLPALSLSLTDQQMHLTSLPINVTAALSDKLLESMTSSIVQELKVPTENLSKTKRLKISIYDGRTSSTVSGVSACAFLGLTVSIVVVMDALKLFPAILKMIQKMKS